MKYKVGDIVNTQNDLFYISKLVNKDNYYLICLTRSVSYLSGKYTVYLTDTKCTLYTDIFQHEE